VVRGSKGFGPGPAARAQRRQLAAEVRRVARHVQVCVIDVAVVDRRVRRGELNQLEREVARALIGAAPSVHRIVADGKTLFGALQAEYSHLQALNDGESRHCAVAAASIVAKVRRDDIFERIAARYRPLFGPVGGGGYVNGATRRFLRAYVERFGRLPPEARRSWPHHHLADILGSNFDPFADLQETAPPQLSLFPASG
jgi:ribonuclease HII